MEAGKPIIAVVHATSKQGTSVVNSLLQTGKFAVKAITRDANSEYAKQLAAKGAELAQADVTDAAQLRAAFGGAYGVFAVTTGLEIFQLKKEFEQGKMMADEAAAAGVKVFVYSTLENVDKRSKGKYVVPPFTDKARTVDYIKANHSGMTGIYPSVAGFYTNWADISRPEMDEDGVLTFAMASDGDLPRALVNPYTAIGPVAAAAFLEPEKYRDIFIPVYDEMISPNKLVETFTQVTGIKARYRQLSQADMEASMPPAWANMLYQMYSYIEEFGYYAPERDMELVHKINPHPETWEEFLKKTGFDGSQSLADIRSKYF